MKQNKIYRLICSLWMIVPVLSLVRLSQPMIEIDMGNGMATMAAMPVKIYNGFQLLIHGRLVNGYNAMVADMRNFGFVVLKIMIALQLISDAIIVVFCLREWKEKQTSKGFLRLRGILSTGYVLTSFAIYQFVSVCGEHLQVDHYHSISQTSYACYFYDELADNILFSVGVVILFIVTWSLYYLMSKKLRKNEGKGKGGEVK